MGTNLRTAYQLSFRTVFFVTIPFSFILIVSSFFVPDMDKFLHLHVAKKLQNAADSSSEGEEKMKVEMAEEKPKVENV